MPSICGIRIILCNLQLPSTINFKTINGTNIKQIKIKIRKIAACNDTHKSILMNGFLS